MVTETRRFKGEWEDTCLGVLADIRSGGTPSTAVPEYWDGEIPWCTPTDITSSNGRYLGTTARCITKSGLDNSSTSLLPAGTLLLCSRATIGEVKIAAMPIATNQGFKSLVCNDLVNKDYLYYRLLPLRDQMVNLATGSTFLEISKRDIGSIQINLPQLSEQRAIAEVLYDTDDLIDSLEVLIAKKRVIKQSAMQELLTGRTRLPGYCGDWTAVRLCEIAFVRDRKVLPSRLDKETLCVDLEHISKGDGRLLTLSTAQHSTSVKNRFCSGDVLFGRLRPYLRKYWLARRGGICTTEIWPLVPDSRYVVSGFLYAVVQSDRFIEVASNSYGTHMPRADWGVMRDFEIRLPSHSEQLAISNVFRDMDAEITALERRLEKTRLIKTGMMQQLLTGAVRLPIPDLDSAEGTNQ